MRLSRLLLVNFKSHERTEIHFRGGVTYIYGDNRDYTQKRSIGAGKSTIPEGISWALWGRIPRNCVKNDVISTWADHTLVELDLVGEEGLLQISRSKQAKDSEKVTATWRNQVLLEPVQERLEKIYGLSFEVFCSTVFIGPQSDVAGFFSAKPGERARLLGELINDKVFQEAAERVAKEMALLEDDRKRLSTTIDGLTVAGEQLTADLQRLQASYAEEQGAQARREALVGQQVYDLELQILNFQERLKSGPARGAAEIISLRNMLDNEIQKVQVRRTVIHSRIHAAECKVGEHCVTCGQVFTTRAAEELGWAKQAMANELKMAERELKVLVGQRDDVCNELSAAQSWGLVKRQIEERIDTAQQQMHPCRTTLENRTLVVLHSEREMVLSRQRDTDAMLEEKRRDLGRINLRVPILKTLYQGFRYDIRNLLADNIRKVLEFYCSQYVQILCENEFSIDFPAVTATGREKFDIVVKRHGEPNRLTSGGESYAAEISVLLALRKALAHQAKSPFSFRLLDDPLERTDDAGGRQFGRLLQAISPEFSDVLVTVPRPFDGLDGKVIVVSRENRRSSVEE